MTGRYRVIAGTVGGGMILGFGLALIFSKDWAWALFEAFYGMLGIQGTRTHLWEMFITTIGLGVSALGVTIILAAWRR